MKDKKRGFTGVEFAWFFGGLVFILVGLFWWWPPAAVVAMGLVMMGIGLS